MTAKKTAISRVEWLRKKYRGCQKCVLHKTRKNVATIAGAVPCDVLFIGESPSRSEDLRGVPFLGPTGRLISAAVKAAAELEELEPFTYACTNVCACRVARGDDDKTTFTPTDDEVWACANRLDDEVKFASPKLVVLLGKTAVAHYAKSFPGCLHMLHPSYVVKMGGQNSPLFHRMVRDLANAIKGVL